MDYSSSTAPPPAEVTTNSFETVYAYRADRLWAAYGAAAVCAAVSVGLGIVSVLSIGETFRNNFSTLFRVSRAAKLSVEVREGDFSGLTPLPDYLAGAAVQVGGKDSTEYHRMMALGSDNNPLIVDDVDPKS